MLDIIRKELIPVAGLIFLGGIVFGMVLAFPIHWLRSRKGQLEPGFHTFDVIFDVVMSVGGVLLTSFWYIRTGNIMALIVFSAIMGCAVIPLNVYLGKLRRKPNDVALEDESSTTKRNKPPPLAGHGNVPFLVTVIPLFIGLTVVNVLLMERYAPFLLDFFDVGGDGDTIRGLLTYFPLPVAFSFAWYIFISWLAKRDWFVKQFYE